MCNMGCRHEVNDDTCRSPSSHHCLLASEKRNEELAEAKIDKVEGEIEEYLLNRDNSR